MEQIFRAISSAVGDLEPNSEIDQAVIFAAWSRCSGEHLRVRTAPLGFAQKRLVIAVQDITWRRHLEELSPQLLVKLNTYVGQGTVRFIEFRIDESVVAVANRSNETAVPADILGVSPSLARAAKAIADEDLRRQFLEAAIGCLTKKENFDYGQIG